MPGKSAGGSAPVSAEGAVEGHRIQSTLENRQLLIIEALEEQLRHAMEMDGHGLAEACEAGVSESDHDATGIGIGAGPLDEAFVD